MAIRKILSDRGIFLFIILTSFFIANALIAEFVGGKIFSLETLLGLQPLKMQLFGVVDLGFNLTAGVILWPLVFVMTDIINEYYGPRAVRILSYITIGIVFYSFLMVYGSIILPPNDWWQFQSGLSGDHLNEINDMSLAFNKVMGQGLWIVIGSMFAFLVGQVLDVFIFNKIKSWTGDRYIWLRSTGSTMVSQLIDSYIVLVIAFYIGADWDLTRVLAIGTVNYIYKGSIAVLLTPLIYLSHSVIDRYLGKEYAESMKLSAIEK